MARLILQGNKEMEVPNETAQIILDDMSRDKMPRNYTIGPIGLKSSTILRVITDEQLSNQNDRTIDNPEYKEKVLSFERDIEAWFQTQPKEKRNFLIFFETKGVVKLYEPIITSSGYHHHGDFGVVDTVRFTELDGYWKALQTLRRRRAYVQEQEAKSAPEHSQFAENVWTS